MHLAYVLQHVAVVQFSCSLHYFFFTAVCSSPLWQNFLNVSHFAWRNCYKWESSLLYCTIFFGVYLTFTLSRLSLFLIWNLDGLSTPFQWCESRIRRYQDNIWRIFSIYSCSLSPRGFSSPGTWGRNSTHDPGVQRKTMPRLLLHSLRGTQNWPERC